MGGGGGGGGGGGESICEGPWGYDSHLEALVSDLLKTDSKNRA